MPSKRLRTGKGDYRANLPHKQRDVPELDTLVKAVDALELADVSFVEVLGRRRREDDEDTQGSLNLEGRAIHDTEVLTTAFRATFGNDRIFLRVHVEVEWRSLIGEFMMAEGVSGSFMSDVAVMTAYPFIRESIQTTAARLGGPTPMIGLIRRGQGEFSDEEEPVTE